MNLTEQSLVLPRGKPIATIGELAAVQTLTSTLDEHKPGEQPPAVQRDPSVPLLVLESELASVGVKLAKDELDPSQYRQLAELIYNNIDLFKDPASGRHEVTDLIEHKIVLKDDKPIRQRPYRHMAEAKAEITGQCVS